MKLNSFNFVMNIYFDNKYFNGCCPILPPDRLPLNHMRWGPSAHHVAGMLALENLLKLCHILTVYYLAYGLTNRVSPV